MEIGYPYSTHEIFSKSNTRIGNYTRKGIVEKGFLFPKNDKTKQKLNSLTRTNSHPALGGSGGRRGSF